MLRKRRTSGKSVARKAARAGSRQVRKMLVMGSMAISRSSRASSTWSCSTDGQEKDEEEGEGGSGAGQMLP